MYILIVVLNIIAIFCVGYYIFAASYAGIASSFLGFWIALAIVCFLGAGVLVLHKQRNILEVIPKYVRIAFCVMLLIGLIIFGIMEGLIISQMNGNASGDVEYLIVLGAQVRGTRVTKSLAKRLNSAIEYYENHKDVKIVCAGGQGSGEDITEASAMKQYLIDKGVNADNIIMEDKSKTTYQNLKFAMEIINDKEAKIAVVTNNFHVYRAIHLAKYVGFENVQGIAGESDNRLLLNYMVREGFALAKELVLR